MCMIASAQGCHENRGPESENASILYLGLIDSSCMSRYSKNEFQTITAYNFSNFFSDVGGISKRLIQ